MRVKDIYMALLLIITTIILTTCISYVDSKALNVTMIIIGFAVVVIVGCIHALGLRREEKTPSTAYPAILLIMILIAYCLYHGISEYQTWAETWELATKIIVPSAMGVLLICNVILIMYINKNEICE